MANFWTSGFWADGFWAPGFWVEDGAPANTPPDTPTISAGAAGSTSVALTSSAFADDDAGDTHASSQWQVAEDADTTFSAPVYDSGEDFVNLTSASGSGLTAETAYRARVRHRDSAGDWSEWSTADTFTTAAVPASDAGRARKISLRLGFGF